MERISGLSRLSPLPKVGITDLAYLIEKYGDQPEWLRISGYREDYDPKRRRRIGELMLSLRGKDYWFPVTPRVYENFVMKAVRENRGKALRYLQLYIRAYRDYNGRWPNRRYVAKNRLRRGSFLA